MTSIALEAFVSPSGSEKCNIHLIHADVVLRQLVTVVTDIEHVRQIALMLSRAIRSIATSLSSYVTLATFHILSDSFSNIQAVKCPMEIFLNIQNNPDVNAPIGA